MNEPAVSREACSHILDRVYQFHDQALSEDEATEIRRHLMACEPCLDHYDVEQAMRLLIRRCFHTEPAPDALRLKIQAAYARTVTITEAE